MSGIDEVLTQDDLVEANRILSLIPILRTRVERILVEMNGEPCTNNLENHVEWNIHQNILSYYLESFHERLKDTIDELTRISRRFNNNIQIELETCRNLVQPVSPNGLMLDFATAYLEAHERLERLVTKFHR